MHIRTCGPFNNLYNQVDQMIGFWIPNPEVASSSLVGPAIP